MVTTDTFLTTLYVMVDDFCKDELEPERNKPGQQASLSRSEVVTLAVYGQWGRFRSERDFYRYALQRLQPAFPTLPDRSQYNRLVRQHCGTIAAVSMYLVDVMGAQDCLYEALDWSSHPRCQTPRRRLVGRSGRHRLEQ